MLLFNGRLLSKPIRDLFLGFIHFSLLLLPRNHELPFPVLIYSLRPRSIWIYIQKHGRLIFGWYLEADISLCALKGSSEPKSTDR
jgi:hypothetical protein